MGGSGGGGPKGWGPSGVGALRGARRGWGPKGGGPTQKNLGPGGVVAQNFALFFLSPAGNLILSSLSGGSSCGILVGRRAQ